MTHDKKTYRSSVLTCDTGCSECKLCRFLSGDYSIPVLLDVIRVLDDNLFASEKAERELIRYVAKKQGT